MPGAKRKLRGLREVRTLSGQADEASLPHRAYMKLACLEMEKTRRRTERSSALDRLKKIDARIRAIEIEQAAIRQGMGGEANGPGPASFGSEAEPGPPRSKGRPFKVKY